MTFSPEVNAFWRWTNALNDQARSSERTPLWINMDETNVALFHGGGKGNVMKHRCRVAPERPGARQSERVHRNVGAASEVVE